ncbi:MAG TPA: SDR family NAD(P)-dependent oxidoreductase, partial [Chloroflexota bacterium]|nr:SDR family NAD(P)-dependent oxidoreductase [Chloroflexota bacterium]
VAIVTGAAQGMGLVTAQEFARRGAIPVLVDINAEKLDRSVQSVRDIDQRAMSIAMDVSKKAQWLDMVKCVHDRFGSIDVLVNNAAISATTPFEHIAEEEWDRVYAVNVKGILFGCQAVAPHMRQQQSGRIINMASQAGKTGGLVIGAHYSSSKAAVICMTKSFASALGRYNITVNAVAPGIINTDFLLGVPGIENSFSRIVLGGKPGEAIDVASAIVFLAGEEARHITGETMNVNGGLLMD